MKLAQSLRRTRDPQQINMLLNSLAPKRKMRQFHLVWRRKRATHARVCSQTLTNWSSKNEIRQRDRRRRTEERREYGKKYSGHE